MMSHENTVKLPSQGLNGDYMPRGFYSCKEAARLAGVPLATVSLWNTKGIVVSTSKMGRRE